MEKIDVKELINELGAMSTFECLSDHVLLPAPWHRYADKGDIILIHPLNISGSTAIEFLSSSPDFKRIDHPVHRDQSGNICFYES